MNPDQIYYSLIDKKTRRIRKVVVDDLDGCMDIVSKLSKHSRKDLLTGRGLINPEKLTLEEFKSGRN